VFVSPTVVGDAVIIGSCAGSVYALDRATGEPVWRYDTSADGPPAQFHGEPLLLGDSIVIPSDAVPAAHLYSFDAASGKLRWKAPFDHGVATTPLVLADRVVVVTSKGEVAALDSKKGSVVWRATPAGTLEALPYIPSPAHASNRIIFADNTNQLFALDASNGSTVWRSALSARPTTPPIVLGDDVVVGTYDGCLTRIALKSGAVTKKTKLPGIPYGTPVVSDGTLLALVNVGTSRLLALDVATHEIRWQQETAKEWTTYRPLLTGSVVIVGNADKDLCAFDRTTGARRWCRPIGQVPRGLGIARDGTLYVGSLSGVVQALRIE
jgi:outer membrane protein assembly factor BamB